MTENILNIPGYKILKQLGQGGMATVYLAEQESTGHTVALKVMSNTLGEDDAWAHRFIKEAQIVAQLSHPNIVPVFDVGSHEGHYFIAMEQMTGGDLDSHAQQGMTITQIIKVIASVAAGLDFAGENGFVHRDIKPDNVMFREDGTPVILDFGIVKQKNEDAEKMTKTGVIVGTTAYMSPEQAQGLALDERSDIYSLGCMMYELLAGYVPYSGDSAMAVLFKHVKEPVPKLPSHLSVFQPIIDKAMAKNLNERFRRGSELIESLHTLASTINEELLLYSEKIDGKTQLVSSISDQNDTRIGENLTRTDNTIKEKILLDKAKSENTTKTDLTEVISSAKSVIANHSVAAQNKRSRKRRTSFTVLALTLVLAFGYIGLKEFYLEPKGIGLSEEEKKVRADKLLKKAGLIAANLDHQDLASIDKLIAIYLEVLKFDDNTIAKKGIHDLVEMFVARTNLSLDNIDIKMADVYQSYIQQLSPQHRELPDIRIRTQEVRAAITNQELEQFLKQKKINNLLTDARTAIKESRYTHPAEKNALLFLEQVLILDTKNTEARLLLNDLMAHLYNETLQLIASLKLEAAAKNIAIFEQKEKNSERHNLLLQQFSVTEKQQNLQIQQRNLQHQLTNMLQKLQALMHLEMTTDHSAQVKLLASNILEIEENNITAQQAMDLACHFDADIATKAIDDRSYDKAEALIKGIQSYHQSFIRLTDVKLALAKAKQNNNKTKEMLTKAETTLQSLGNEPEERKKNMKKVLSYLEVVRYIDASNNDLHILLASLENEYILSIKQLIAEDNKWVKSYFNDIDNTQWPSDKLQQLQQQYKESKAQVKPITKRVMTGGF